MHGFFCRIVIYFCLHLFDDIYVRILSWSIFQDSDTFNSCTFLFCARSVAWWIISHLSRSDIKSPIHQMDIFGTIQVTISVTRCETSISKQTIIINFLLFILWIWKHTRVLMWFCSKRGFIYFQINFARKWTQRIQLEFQHGSPVPHQAALTATLHRHPFTINYL